LLFDCLNDFVTVFIDNILIYSINKAEYKLYVKKVLYRLRKAKLQTNIKKYKFYIKLTRFLKFIIEIDGIRIDPKKIFIIIN